jgi:nitrous oxide reductase accessory protein NosL
MKKILPALVIILMLAVVTAIFISIAKEDQPVTVQSGNMAMKPLPIKIGHTNDPQCAMLLKSYRNAVEVVAPDGRTWFFDDPGCMILWLEKKSFRDKAKIWVHTLDTKKWIDARSAYYGVADQTEMRYGFGAREHEGNETIDFREMRLRMLRGENMTDPKIRKKLLGI